MKKIKIQSLFREAWNIFKKNFGILVGAGLVVMAISGIQQSLISFATPAEGELPGLAYILTFLFQPLFLSLFQWGQFVSF